MFLFKGKKTRTNDSTRVGPGEMKFGKVFCQKNGFAWLCVVPAGTKRNSNLLSRKLEKEGLKRGVQFQLKILILLRKFVNLLVHLLVFIYIP